MPQLNKNFAVFKASAGSGKTYTLVKEYLRIALGERGLFSFKQILAITFTNKAASEMKDRILENLHKISHQQDENLIQDYCKEFDIERNTLVLRAKEVFEYMLHNYSDLNVSTIDKFTHKILRSFAKDLNVPLDFDIEMDSKSFLSKIIDEIISKVGEEEDFSKILIGFIESKSEEEKSWNVNQALYDVANSILDEKNEESILLLREHTLQDFIEIITILKNEINQIKKRFKEIGIEVLSLFENNGISQQDVFQGRNGLFGFFEKLSDSNLELTINSYHLKTIEEDKWTSGKCSISSKAAIEGISDLIKERFYEVKQQKELFMIKTIIQKNIYGIALVNEIAKEMTRLKEESNVILISDFNKIIHQEIKNQPVPFIYEKIGERFKNIMIDEFQDTSVFQWQNFIPLLENSLSEGNYNLIVGDAKQSIYRFRNGEVEQFVALPKLYGSEQDELLALREDTFEVNYKNQTLDTNYRSKKEIIEFNNLFFDKIQMRLPEKYKSIYEGHAQKFIASKTGGYVEIELLDKQDKESDLHLSKVVEKIQQSLTDGYQLSDIAIIIRNNKEGNRVAEHLSSLNIGVVSSESLLLKNSERVKLLVAFLSFIENPINEFSKFELLNQLIQYRGEQNIILNYVERGHRTFKVLLDDYFKDKGIHINFNNLATENIYNIIEYIVRVFHLNENVDAYLTSFLNFVFSFSTKQQTIREFLEKWEKTKEKLSIKSSKGSNAVEIITIHKSKGLQYPVVIMPYCNWDFSVGSEKRWLSLHNEVEGLPSSLFSLSKKGLEETIYSSFVENEQIAQELDNYNALYVGFTRPEDRLYVISEKPFRSSRNIFESVRDFVEAESDGVRYTYGERTVRETKIKQDSTSEIKNIVSNEWKGRLRISNQYSKIENGGEFNKQIELGNVIHEILSIVRNMDDLDNVIQEKKMTGELREHDEKMIREELEKTILLEKSFFEGKHHTQITEFELKTQNGDFLRPDKVLFYSDKTIVIDYKTGEKEDKHIKQIKGYRAELLNMGYKTVESYLIYTKYGEIVEV